MITPIMINGLSFSIAAADWGRKEDARDVATQYAEKWLQSQADAFRAVLHAGLLADEDERTAEQADAIQVAADAENSAVVAATRDWAALEESGFGGHVSIVAVPA